MIHPARQIDHKADHEDKTMRQKIPSGIFDLLDQELTLSRELLTLLDREQAAVVAMNMNELLAVTRSKADEIQHLQNIDEQLRLQVEQATGKPSENAVRLSDLAAMTSGEDKAKLERMRKELVALRQDIAAKSVVNQHFVEDTKRHLHDAISLITNAASEKKPQSYGKPGRMMSRPQAKAPSLISREV